MIETRREHPHGTVTNIFNFECASLVVIKIGHGDEQLLPVSRVGDFVVNLYVQAVTHIMMTTCGVSDLQWPLSRDSMVIRVGERSSTFVMLGLLYGLRLPPVCGEDMVDTLERVFIKFGDYTGLNNEENVQPVIESMARVKVGNNWRLMEGNEATSLSKVVRTSATNKIVSNAILTSFLKPMYIEIFVVKMEDERKRDRDSEDAFSSISAVTDIVSSFGTVQEITVNNPQVPEDARKDDGSETTSRIKVWKFNQLGFAVFLRHKSKLLC